MNVCTHLIKTKKQMQYLNCLSFILRQDSNIKIVSSTFKLSSPFSTRDKVLYVLYSDALHKCIRTGCNSSYVGNTQVHISTSTHKYLQKLPAYTKTFLKTLNVIHFLMTTAFNLRSAKN